MSEQKQQNHDVWQAVKDQMSDTKLPIKLRNNVPNGSYYDIKFGIPNAYLSLHYLDQENCAKVMINFRNERGEVCFKELLRQKEQVEAEIGASLDWDPAEHAQYCSIVLWKRDVDLGTTTTMSELADWYVTWLGNFHKALFPLLSAIPK